MYTTGCWQTGDWATLCDSVQIIAGGGLLYQECWEEAVFASIFIIAVHLTAMEEVISSHRAFHLQKKCVSGYPNSIWIWSLHSIWYCIFIKKNLYNCIYTLNYFLCDWNILKFTVWNVCYVEIWKIISLCTYSPHIYNTYIFLGFIALIFMCIDWIIQLIALMANLNHIGIWKGYLTKSGVYSETSHMCDTEQ